MKKSVLYLCAGMLAFGLTACGGDPDKGSSSEGSQFESGSSQGTEQTGSSGADSSVTDNSGADDSQNSSPSENTESGADDGQTGAEGWSEEMAGLRAAVVDAVGQDEYWPDMPMDAEMLNMVYGVTSDMYEDYMAESPMISANVDTMVIIKAKTDQVDAVFDLMTAYRENLVNDTMQYPSNLGKIQSSRVEKVGDYVIFLQLGGMAGIAENEEEAIKQSQAANEKALEAIKGKLE